MLDHLLENGKSPFSQQAQRLFYPSDNLRAYECILPVRNDVILV